QSSYPTPTPIAASARYYSVASSGTLASGRSLAVNLTSSLNGIRGTLSFRDGPGRFSFLASTIHSMDVVNGVPTTVGTGKVGTKTDYGFRMTLREKSSGMPAHAVFELSAPGVASYRAESDFASGVVKLNPLGVIGGGPTPTRTPITGDGGGTVVAAGA